MSRGAAVPELNLPRLRRLLDGEVVEATLGPVADDAKRSRSEVADRHVLDGRLAVDPDCRSRALLDDFDIEPDVLGDGVCAGREAVALALQVLLQVRLAGRREDLRRFRSEISSALCREALPRRPAHYLKSATRALQQTEHARSARLRPGQSRRQVRLILQRKHEKLGDLQNVGGTIANRVAVHAFDDR